MRFLKNKVCLLILLISFSCISQRAQDEFSSDKKSKALIDLLDVLYKNELEQLNKNKEFNFHCKEEHLNNNVFIVDIIINSSLPDRNKKLVQYLKSKNDNNVFIYGEKKNEKLILELESKKLITEDSFLNFDNNSKSWRIIVTIEKSNNIYEKLSPLGYWNVNKNNKDTDW